MLEDTLFSFLRRLGAGRFMHLITIKLLITINMK